MNLKRAKIKWKRKSLDWVFNYGKYNNCRLAFVIEIDPKYVLKEIQDKRIYVDIAASNQLRFALQKIGWDNYLTN